MDKINPAPLLSRFVPTAVLLALAVHVFLGAVFFLSPPSTGGGGGQVLGQLSVSLGGSGVAGYLQQDALEPAVETRSRPPVPRVEPRSEPQSVVETIAPTPRVVQSTPIVRRPVEVPRVSESIEREVPVNQADGDRGDGDPVGASSAGTPSLGEGAASQTAGLGSADAEVGDQRDAYLALIRSRIENNRTYPSAARRRREEGTAMLKITIGRQGHLTEVQLVDASGSFHLDRAARRMVEKSAPFPAPPVTPFSTHIPIVFALR
ncbi:energy transducer TonB [Parvibaculaceae bacterium PLY_AMNH_Bact1]|nr:energy transducer TonB [Parvibaculaceae bacterium PLY_AMNH_Bact1]